jgi:sulfur-oxidizing protein SoxX
MSRKLLLGMLIASATLLSPVGVAAAEPLSAEALHAIMKRSMQAKNQAGLDRLQQTEVQVACSRPRAETLEPERFNALRTRLAAAVQLPEDGRYLGDWKRGAAIAQNGRGLQYSDDPSQPNGGNCYACHQLDPAEVAYGNIGLSLTNYGARGRSPEVLEYTWTKIWDPHVYMPCSHMPRFGASGILTMEQLRDVMAYLLDPESPVNASP